MLSRSRTISTRMIGGFDERDTCLETETIRMSLCNARAMWAAAGSYNCGGIPGSVLARYSIVRRCRPRVKIKSRAGFLRKGARSR